MGVNMNLYAEAWKAHYRDLLREAEKNRRLSPLPWHRRSMGRRAAGLLGMLLLKLGMWLMQFANHSRRLRRKLALMRGIGKSRRESSSLCDLTAHQAR